MQDFYRQTFQASIQSKTDFLDRSLETLVKVSEKFVDCFQNGGKALLFGNGGSAADAQHLAAEFVNRLILSRRAIPAIALTTDTSILTSVANDYSFDQVFARQVEALGNPNDIAVGISTSGNSTNVHKALEVARSMEMCTVGFLGGTGGSIARIVDYALIVPSNSAQRIQESHITIGHAMCEWVEHTLFDGIEHDNG